MGRAHAYHVIRPGMRGGIAIRTEMEPGQTSHWRLFCDATRSARRSKPEERIPEFTSRSGGCSDACKLLSKRLVRAGPLPSSSILDQDTALSAAAESRIKPASCIDGNNTDDNETLEESRIRPDYGQDAREQAKQVLENTYRQ